MSKLTSEDFGELFRTFKRSAFRLERLQTYDAPSDRGRFAHYQETGEALPNQPWLATVRAAAEAGKTMRRVRVVRLPHTLYTEFELRSYRYSAEAGEDIRILPRESWYPEYSHDVWLFDNKIAVVMTYNDDGRFLYARLGDAAEVRASRVVRDDTLAAAIPLTEYLTTAGV